MPNQEPIRLCEWGSVNVDLTPDQRHRIFAAADKWREYNRLPVPPLDFSGVDGTTLCTRQYVGVVEVEGISIEIYPKLDSVLLESETVDEGAAKTVMRNLLWILEASGYAQVIQTDTAHLEGTALTYDDLFSYLMAGDLLRQMEVGLAHTYVRQEDDIPWVRGRIRLEDQITRNWMRPDRIACSWDEFTPNIALNRMFKCACRTLSQRVRHPFVSALLNDCVWMLDEAEDVDAFTALHDAATIRWDRSNERFRHSFDVARQLLSGMGYDLASGESRTFVFLLDMNLVFEMYALKVLETVVAVSVQYHDNIGYLIRKPRQRIRQIPDFWWNTSDACWIADAKYKFLFQGNVSPVSADEDADDWPVEGNGRWYLHPNDLRQITVYAEILKRRLWGTAPVNLLVVYPYAGQGAFEIDDSVSELWNGSPLYLMPVKMTRCLGNDLRLAAPEKLPTQMMPVRDADVA
ncbi:MAG: hypothetical protein Q7J98_08355 [Kiritimatiellia bacterium]|nr:hypothetical protein [Kiritimatiellia bacterium]